MAWGPPTTKEALIKTADELSEIALYLVRLEGERVLVSPSLTRMKSMGEIIGKLRSQIDHIPWEEVDHDNP